MANHSGQCRCSSVELVERDATAGERADRRGQRHDPSGERVVEAVVVVVPERGRRDPQRRRHPQRQPVRRVAPGVEVDLVDRRHGRPEAAPLLEPVDLDGVDVGPPAVVVARLDTHNGRPSVSGTSTVIASARSSGASSSSRSKRIDRPSTCQVARARGRQAPAGLLALGHRLTGRVELTPQHEAVPPGADPTVVGHDLGRDPAGGPRALAGVDHRHPAHQALVDRHLVEPGPVRRRQVVAAGGPDERDHQLGAGAAMGPHRGGRARPRTGRAGPASG